MRESLTVIGGFPLTSESSINGQEEMVVSPFPADPEDAVTPERRRARQGTVKVSHLRCHIPAKIWNIGGVIPATRGEILPDDPDDPIRTAIRQVM
jgi:hypothetical protein